ncbi:MAG: ABC transporter ATP-binding protein [Bacteroidales bacterium]|nr:ABC transporter ATP-binding protein [Bacteroidales bacterium]MCF8328612.1 ABC transporter ATP-binding protein [Bacteroidales bacterium]
MALLEVNNLSISFQSEGISKEVVHNVSFTLEKGRTLGIVGESGSGKSVTCSSIIRLLPEKQSTITSGEILFSNEDKPISLLNLSEKKMQDTRGNRISMIFQEPMTALNPVVTCGKQVSEILQRHRKMSSNAMKKRVLELFREVMLPSPQKIYHSYPHQISGGQKQRVMIAMAMACEPDILIADEPTTALDVTVQKTILELMAKLQEKYNTGIIFITHDLGVIAEIADEVAVMLNGEIVESGEAKTIFNNPQHPYTQGLLACRPPLDQRPEKLLTIKDFMQSKQENQKQHPTLVSEAQRKQKHERLYAQTPIMEIQNLVKRFPTRKQLFKSREYFTAVDSTNFYVYPGETLGLVGESGCGKTTLGRTLMGMLKVNEGKILYKNQDITSLPPNKLRQLRKKVQIIFQDPYSSLNPRITIGSAIEEPMRVHQLVKGKKQRKQKVLELLDKVGLDSNHYNRYPHEFSGGQRQRVCIARALAMQPEFIICDESVSALDVSVQAQVLNLFNELKEDFGFTYIFISHDLSVVRYMSDRVLVMKDGKLIESNEADELYAHPQNDYTKTLIEAIPKQ